MSLVNGITVKTIESCEARTAPSLIGAVVGTIPSGTDLKFLRDEDRDFIKVAYAGRPVYVAREAVTPPATTLAPAGAAIHSFDLSTDRPRLVRFMVSNAASPTGLSVGLFVAWNVLWFFSSSGAPGEPYREIYLALYAVLLLGAAIGTWRTTPKGYADVSDTAVILRGYGNRVIPLAKIESIDQRNGRWPDLLAISSHLPPWGATLLYGRPVGCPLRLILTKGSWLGLLTRFRRVLINPQDQTGFLKAVREVAPSVQIDPGLLPGSGAQL